MLINYRQGLVSAPANFLQPGTVSNYVGIVVGPGPVLATIADGSADYLIGISASVDNAWGPFTGSTTQFLFVELNDVTGAITFGSTSLAVATGSTAPSSPAIGQMWWDPTNLKHFVWDGVHWQHTLRVFLGRLDSGATLVQETPVSQVGLNVPTYAGYVLTDGFGHTFRTDNGTLLTTDTPLLSSNTQSLVKIDGAQVVVQANEPIPAFTCVYLVDGRAEIASSDPPFEIATSPIGMIVQDTAQNDPAELIMAGKMVFNQNWNFSTTDWGAPLYCDSNGQITLIVPSTPNYVRVGYIVNAQGIYLTFDTVTNPIVLSGAIELFTTAPLNLNTSGPVPILSISQASNSTDGYISSTDFARIGAIEAQLPNFALTTATWPISSVTGLQSALNGKAALVHTHVISDVTGLQSALDGKLNVGDSIPISQVTSLQSSLNTINTTIATKIDKVPSAVPGNIAVFITGGNVVDSSLNSSSFAAASHSHSESDIANLTTDLAGKAAVVHTHNISDVVGLQTQLNTITTKTDKVSGAVDGDFAALNALGNLVDSGYNPSSFSLLVHVHSISDVTGLQTALDGKLPIAQAIPISQVTNLQTTLNNKSDVGHTHTIANVTGLQSVLDSKLNLSGGTLTGSLTAPSITTTAAVSVGTNLSVGSVFVVNQNGSISLSSTTGSAGQVLTSNGSSAASWSTLQGIIPSGGSSGQVLAKIDNTNYNVQWVNQSGGASANLNEIVYGTGSGMTSSSSFKFVTDTMFVPNISGNSGTTLAIFGANGDAISSGASVSITGGSNSLGNNGGNVSLVGGAATGSSGTGGSVSITSGASPATLASGAITISTAAGNATNGSSGTLTLSTGASTGTGTAGSVDIKTNNTLRLRITKDGEWNVNGGVGTSGQVLTSNGTGSTPQWSSLPAGNPGTVTSIDVSGGTTGLITSGGPITSSGTITLSGTLIAANGGTGFASYTIGDILYAATTTTLAKLSASTAGKVLTSNGAGVAPSWQDSPAGNPGTVTSVNVSGGTTGLSVTGGPITSSGTLTISGTLAIANGGTGQTTATAAFQALAPSATLGSVLVNDVDGNWVAFSPSFPTDQGKALIADSGSLTGVSWIDLPSPNPGTVTSVGVSGGSTGLSFTGGPITSSGTITLSGTLAAVNGGTGINSYTIGDLLYASSSTALSALPSDISGKVLTANGVGVAPSWQDIPSPPAVSASANEIMYGTGTGYTSSPVFTVNAGTGYLYTSSISANSNAGEPVAFTLIGATGTASNAGGSMTVAAGENASGLDGGALSLFGGSAVGSVGNGGNVSITSGDGANDSSASSGAISITTGTSGVGTSGNITINTGAATTVGDVDIQTGGVSRILVSGTGDITVGAASVSVTSAGNITFNADSSTTVQMTPDAVVASKPIVFPIYTLSSLPTGSPTLIGGMIFVSDANSGVGAMAFYNGTSWIDTKTGITVA